MKQNEQHRRKLNAQNRALFKSNAFWKMQVNKNITLSTSHSKHAQKLNVTSRSSHITQSHRRILQTCRVVVYVPKASKNNFRTAVVCTNNYLNACIIGLILFTAQEHPSLNSVAFLNLESLVSPYIRESLDSYAREGLVVFFFLSICVTSELQWT